MRNSPPKPVVHTEQDILVLALSSWNCHLSNQEVPISTKNLHFWHFLQDLGSYKSFSYEIEMELKMITLTGYNAVIEFAAHQSSL